MLKKFIKSFVVYKRERKRERNKQRRKEERERKRRKEGEWILEVLRLVLKL